MTPSFGVAAVTLPAGSVDRAGLLGCACVDLDAGAGIAVSCTVVSKRGGLVWTSPVEWEVATSPSYLSCVRVRVVVQSIRWPAQRISVSGRGLSGTCIADGTCLAADAAVYVIPVCGGSGPNVLACFPSGAFAKSNCFPYCMALRLVSDSAAQPLLMRGGGAWADGVLLAQRSCVASSTPPPQTTDMATTTTRCQLTPFVHSAVSSLARYCPFSYACDTWVLNRSVASPTYLPSTTPPIASATGPLPLGGGVYVALSGQPLVVAGGALMRMRIQLKSDKLAYSVDFPQLVGDQYNEFTMDVGLQVPPPRLPLQRGSLFGPLF